MSETGGNVTNVATGVVEGLKDQPLALTVRNVIFIGAGRYIYFGMMGPVRQRVQVHHRPLSGEVITRLRDCGAASVSDRPRWSPVAASP
jgi:hypothetical protein